MESLTLRSFGVEAGGRPLLARVELQLRAGEHVAVAGPSGCGKTTLLRAIAGLTDASAGSVTLDGETPAQIGWPIWRRRVTYVAQRPVMLSGTVDDNLRRPFSFRSVGGSVPEARIAEWLRALRLSADRRQQSARSLSVGEQQRVALIRAVAIDPDVLLLDEPTSALDEDAAAALTEGLRHWSQRDRAVLVVSHDAGAAARMCDRRIDLNEFLNTRGQGA